MNNNPEKNRENRDHKGQFIPGTSGNPKGRPEGTGGVSIVAAIKRELEKIPTGEQKSNLQIIVAEMLKKGRKGDEKILRLLLNYVEGMPKQAVKHEGGDEPIKISWEK